MHWGFEAQGSFGFVGLGPVCLLCFGRCACVGAQEYAGVLVV